MSLTQKLTTIMVTAITYMLSACDSRYDNIRPSVASSTGSAIQETTDGVWVDYKVTMPLVNLADGIIADTHGNRFCIQSNPSGIYSFYTKDTQGGYHLHMIPSSLVTIYQQDDHHEIVITGEYVYGGYGDDLIHLFIEAGDFESYLTSIEAINFKQVKRIDLYIPKEAIIENYDLDAA